MTRYLFPLILLAGCAAPPAPDPAPTESALRDGLVGQRFAWDHVSGVSGEMIHYADGTMVYDSDGRERTAEWTLNVEDRYCMNSGDYDQVCFTLVETPAGYASEDGTFTYARQSDLDAPFPDAGPLDATGPLGAPVGPASSYDDAMGYDASIYLPPDATIFGDSDDLPVVTGPID